MTLEAAEPERTCELAARAGRVEVCTEACPLWEDGTCTLEGLLGPGAAWDPDAEPHNDLFRTG